MEAEAGAGAGVGEKGMRKKKKNKREFLWREGYWIFPGEGEWKGTVNGERYLSDASIPGPFG